MAQIACTSCGGGNIQKLSMVYQSGISTVETSHSGKIKQAHALFHNAETNSRTTTTQVSALAQRAAPPAKRPFFGILALGALVAWAVNYTAGLFYGTLTAIAFLALAWWCLKYNFGDHKLAMQAWRRSWLCHGCGHTFVA